MQWPNSVDVPRITGGLIGGFIFAMAMWGVAVIELLLF